jgi:peptidoglycan/LPS O-acetylase OafA/YrhL
MAVAVPSDGARREDHRPHLDGLRAVAVYLVVAFHAGWGRFNGGFVGVDVFFVLSGYLVTQLLLRDLEPTGSVRFRRFYARRFRRLLPAAFVALVVTAVVFSAIASPVELAESLGAFKASFLYSANWFFIAESSQYFAADVAANPVLHFWSLAVEEQFYLLWPVLLAGLFALASRFGAHRPTVLRVVVALGGLASVAWAWSLRDDDPNRAYYGTDARAYQLLAGALLALSPELIARLGLLGRSRPAARWVALASVVGLVVVASSSIHLDPIERGTVVTVVTMAVIVALEVAGGGLVHGALSLGPVVYLGKVSYGTYLWHWPVVLVMARSFEVSAIATVAFTVLIATALASLSFQLVEHPIRVSPWLDRHRTPVIATGLATSVVAALVLIPAIVDRADDDATTGAVTDPELATAGFTPVPDLDFVAVKADFPGFWGCYDEPASACTKVRGSGPHLLLIGDSHGAMISPAFEAFAKEADLTLSIAVGAGCPWQQGLTVPGVRAFGVNPADCIRDRADVYDRVIEELDVDIVVAINRSYETADNGPKYAGEDEVLHDPGSPELEALLTESTERSLERLRADGRRVVVIEPTPITSDFEPLTCLESATVVEACRSIVEVRPTNLELLYRRLAEERDRVWSLDLDELVCPYLPICDPIVDGMVVRRDGSHMTRTYARSLAPTILAYLRDRGVLDAAG